MAWLDPIDLRGVWEPPHRQNSGRQLTKKSGLVMLEESNGQPAAISHSTYSLAAPRILTYHLWFHQIDRLHMYIYNST